jgi:hypothetical protein
VYVYLSHAPIFWKVVKPFDTYADALKYALQDGKYTLEMDIPFNPAQTANVVAACNRWYKQFYDPLVNNAVRYLGMASIRLTMASKLGTRLTKSF